MGRWATIRDRYVQCTGDTPRARSEAWSHLGDAQQALAASIDVPELAAIDESVVVSAGNDYVNVSSIDFSVYAVLDVFNATDKIPMYPEPNGAIGRRVFLTGDAGKPTVAQLTHYQRDGAKLYVRGTASVDTTLRVRVQRQMPDLDSSSAGSDPITPKQYDPALAFKAAELYYLTHPAENMVTEGERSTLLSSKYREAYRELVGEIKPVRTEEARPRTRQFRLSGFRVAPRSRR